MRSEEALLVAEIAEKLMAEKRLVEYHAEFDGDCDLLVLTQMLINHAQHLGRAEGIAFALGEEMPDRTFVEAVEEFGEIKLAIG